MVLRLAHVELASQDRLDSLGLGRIEKMHRSIDVSVVRHGDGLLAERGDAVNELVDVAGAVEKRVFGVQMKMREFGHGLTSILLGPHLDHIRLKTRSNPIATDH